MTYNNERKDKLRASISAWKYYAVVIVSFIISVFLVPLLGSWMGGETRFPQTPIEWIIYFVSAIAVAICSLMIFLALHEQGKELAKRFDEYKQAKELHIKNTKRQSKEIIPINPFEWEKNAKIKKGIFQTIGIFFGLLGLALGVLKWNTAQCISDIISFLIALMFGLIQMGASEEMFSEGWLEWEQYVEKMLDEEAKKQAVLETFEQEQCKDTPLAQKLAEELKNIQSEEVTNAN